LIGKFDEINARIKKVAEETGTELRVFQSNSEGALVDAIHDARHWVDGAGAVISTATNL